MSGTSRPERAAEDRRSRVTRRRGEGRERARGEAERGAQGAEGSRRGEEDRGERRRIFGREVTAPREARERERGYVGGAPKASGGERGSRARPDGERLRAEEEARERRRPERRRTAGAGVPSSRGGGARRGTRDEASADRSARAPAPYPGVTRDGEVATLVEEVARLERELEAAKAAAASGAYARPGSIADAAAASTRAANEAAAEADAAIRGPRRRRRRAFFDADEEPGAQVRRLSHLRRLGRARGSGVS